MIERTPSRLPAAFVRVSKCPICRYSLKDLTEELPCPECGSVIDGDLLTSFEMKQAVESGKGWCIWGAICWTSIGFGYWLIGVASSVISGDSEMADVLRYWTIAGVIITPAAFLVIWHRRMKRMIYANSIRNGSPPKLPGRVIAVTLTGMMLAMSGCLLFSIIAR